MAETCTLTGILLDPAGAGFGGAKVILQPTSRQPVVTAAGDIVAPVVPAAAVTDEDGALVLTLAPGLYRGSATQGAGGRSFNFDLAVPDLPTAPLADYIGRIDVEVQTSAQLARDQAEEALAATILVAEATAADRVQTGLDRTVAGQEAQVAAGHR
ncbi:hypothetical protein, partial [Tabrizicola fusiformis]|uniref:hypothetical protein n=1 Tax=Tabrizicola sp. SY72 TaxID=2741673 RepID=UPI001574A640